MPWTTPVLVMTGVSGLVRLVTTVLEAGVLEGIAGELINGLLVVWLVVLVVPVLSLDEVVELVEVCMEVGADIVVVPV